MGDFVFVQKQRELSNEYEYVENGLVDRKILPLFEGVLLVAQLNIEKTVNRKQGGKSRVRPYPRGL